MSMCPRAGESTHTQKKPAHPQPLMRGPPTLNIEARHGAECCLSNSPLQHFKFHNCMNFPGIMSPLCIDHTCFLSCNHHVTLSFTPYAYIWPLSSLGHLPALHLHLSECPLALKGHQGGMPQQFSLAPRLRY